jgi:hypothetical protein
MNPTTHQHHHHHDNNKKNTKNNKKRKRNKETIKNDDKQSMNRNHHPSKVDGFLTLSNPATNHRINHHHNPLLYIHHDFIQHHVSSMEYHHYFSNEHVDSDRRSLLWMKQYDIGQDCINQYSWAIPDIRAMKVLSYFSPIIEIGCGKNAYWCQQMKQHGIDVMGYDINLHAGGTIIDYHPDTNDNDSNNKKNKKKNDQQNHNNKNSNKKKKQQVTKDGETDFHVRHGGPEVLKLSSNQNRTLFLCYPDEYDDDNDDDDSNNNKKNHNHPHDHDDDDHDDDHSSTTRTDSMAYQCLQHYTGEYVIHVGELYTQSTPTFAMEQAPWGRTSSPEFQQLLANTFHCILRISLPNWLHTSDTLTIWKRSTTCTIVYETDSDNDNAEDENDTNHHPTNAGRHHHPTHNNDHNKKMKRNHSNRENNDSSDDTTNNTNTNENNDDEVQFRYIPPHEKLPIDAVAPCLQHLFDQLPSPQPLLFRQHDDIVNDNNDNDDDKNINNNNKNKNIPIETKRNNKISRTINEASDTNPHVAHHEQVTMESLLSEKTNMSKNKKKKRKKQQQQQSPKQENIINHDYQSPW